MARKILDGLGPHVVGTRSAGCSSPEHIPDWVCCLCLCPTASKTVTVAAMGPFALVSQGWCCVMNTLDDIALGVIDAASRSAAGLLMALKVDLIRTRDLAVLCVLLMI